MLKYLHIENIAVIEQSSIEFSNGFNVLTGETGAGKSIIIDAIYAVLGHRTSKELIRNNCEKAKVSAVFSLVDESVQTAFADAGIVKDTDGNFVIERTLSVSGNGFIKVNGIPVSATVLKNISPKLLNIHGQHDNQALLDSDNHVTYIDRLAENDKELLEYRDEFKRFNSIRAKLKSLEMDEDEKLRRIDILKYQINELESSSLKIGEMAELKERLAVARNIGNRIKTLNGVLSHLKDDDENSGALSLLRDALHLINVSKDIQLDDEIVKLQDAIENTTTVIDSVENIIFALNSDEYNIDIIEDRLAVLSNLASKYGENEEKMLGFLSNAKEELNTILFNDDEVDRLSDELIDSQNQLIKKAEKLTDTRIKAGRVFEKGVKKILIQLNMPAVEISVECKKGRYTKNGCDEVELLFSANAGETKKPLTKIASGGELSRVMLAIKSILAEKDDVNTLIFDEIDSGISGVTADKVGVQLRNVADNHQVICVTHLAQIASVADNHLLITKDVSNGKTYTVVEKIDGAERVKEIARIMGGSQVTDELLLSAEQLINNGKK